MGVQRRGARLRIPGDPRLRRVLTAYGLSAFTEFATWLAILLVAYREGGAVMVGVASFAMQVPAIVLVPLLAGIGDRIPRGRALALAHAGVALAALLTGALLLGGAPAWAVLVGGAALTVAVCLVRPMHFAVLPLLARQPGDLVAANALSSSIDGVAVFVGFVVAGILTDVAGPWVVLLGCGVLAILATLLTSGLHTPVVAVADGDAPGEVRAALAGLAQLRRSRGALVLLLLMACTAVVEGSNETLTVTHNDQVLGLTESTAGLLAGAYGIGMALGGATLAGLAHRRRLAPVVVGGAVLLGLAQASVALLGSLGPVVLALVLVGVGVSLVMVSARTLLQRTTEDAVLARVLAIQEGVQIVGLTLGAIVGPVLVLWLGPSRAFVPLGALVVALGLLSYGTIRRLEATATLRQAEVDLLGRVPFLAPLPPYELERLAQSAAWCDVAAGTAVTTQGEVGDTYYLVARGELSVSVDGRLREHTLGIGDGFGEIALLARVPRTATVTALTDCVLLTLGSERFLAAVTASPEGAALAHRHSDVLLAADRQH